MKEATIMEKAKVAIIAATFLTILLTLASPALCQSANPNVYVDPLIYSASATGETFTVNINVTDAVGVAGYGINMRFDSAILVPSAWQSGGFLESSGVGTLGLASGNHSDIGWISLGDILSGPGSASGNGTLVKITFKTLGGGRCALDLYNTSLLDDIGDTIGHTATDGQFIYNYITLIPATGPGAFMIQGFGFGQEASIASVTCNGTGTPIMTTRCDGRGNFVTPAMPNVSTPGNYTISVIDSVGNHKEAIFTLTAATGPQGPEGPTGPQGTTGATGPQGPAGTGGASEYTWAALILSIVAILIGIYAVMKRKS